MKGRVQDLEPYDQGVSVWAEMLMTALSSAGLKGVSICSFSEMLSVLSSSQKCSNY